MALATVVLALLGVLTFGGVVASPAAAPASDTTVEAPRAAEPSRASPTRATDPARSVAPKAQNPRHLTAKATKHGRHHKSR